MKIGREDLPDGTARSLLHHRCPKTESHFHRIRKKRRKLESGSLVSEVGPGLVLEKETGILVVAEVDLDLKNETRTERKVGDRNPALSPHGERKGERGNKSFLVISFSLLCCVFFVHTLLINMLIEW